MNNWLPAHIQASLPESIRAGGYRHDNAEQLRAAELAVETLSNTEQIHTLTQRVINEQLQRLVRRWSAAVPSFPIQQPSKAKENRPKGFEGLSRKKIDLSRYLDDDLTEKQRTAFSLKHEYGLGLTEIASRMGIDRKTAYEHIQAAARQIDQARSGERRKANRAKISPEE